MTYVFDLDGTICTDRGGNYEEVDPQPGVIKALRYLYSAGHTIVVDTARGSQGGQRRRRRLRKLTTQQLAEWDVPYHQLRVGVKIGADCYVDDRAVTPDDIQGFATPPTRRDADG